MQKGSRNPRNLQTTEPSKKTRRRRFKQQPKRAHARNLKSKKQERRIATCFHPSRLRI